MMSQPKQALLFVIFSLKPGGTQRMMINVLNEIKPDGIKKILFLYNFTEGFSLEHQVCDDIKIYRSSYQGNFKYLVRLYILIKLIYKEKINKIISFSTNGSYLSIIARFFFFLKKINLVYRLVSVDEALVDSKSTWIKEIKKIFFIHFLCRRTDTIIGQSKYMSDNLIQKKPQLLKDKVITINNILPVNKIIELSEEPIEIKHPYILYVGRLSEEKNIIGIIKAFELIQSKIEENLVIIGEGILEKNLKQYVKDNDLSNRVDFLGIKENPYKYMSHAKVLVLFSEYEGMPNVVLEAMVCKTAVIVSDFKGVEDIVPNDSVGSIVQKQNIQQLSREFETIFDFSKNKSVRVIVAFEHINNFNKKSISQYSEIIKF